MTGRPLPSVPRFPRSDGPRRSSGPGPSEVADRTRRIKERARSLGLDPVGVSHPPEPDSPSAGFLVEWLEKGYHGEMRYLEREDAVRRRARLEETLPGVRSVIVVGQSYFQEDPEGVPDDPSVGVVARYARGRDYHKVLKKKMMALLRWIVAEVAPEARGRAYVDTGPILERDLARRAGLGWFGRNTMLIDPRRGSYFFLGALLLDLELEADEPFEADRCGSCRACLDACPTGALLGRDENGAPVMDARRCISYLTIENRGPIPEKLRPAIGNRVYGCDICQEVCPFPRRFSTPSSEPAYSARSPGEPPLGVDPLSSDVWHPGTSSPALVELLRAALDESSWDSFSRGSAIRRAGRSGFARNVCVGLGNWGSDEAVPVLRSALRDPEPLVRGHAAWALGCIGSADAGDALSAALAAEDDPFVRGELESALERPLPSPK